MYEPRARPLPVHARPYKLVGCAFTKYGHEVQDADALWTAVCEALKVQRGAPENLCVHCWKLPSLGKTDT